MLKNCWKIIFSDCFQAQFNIVLDLATYTLIPSNTAHLRLCRPIIYFIFSQFDVIDNEHEGLNVQRYPRNNESEQMITTTYL